MPFPQRRPQSTEEQRIRLPRRNEGELVCVVSEQMGGSRLTVQCEDGKERMCRIPGRIRRKLWIKNGDYVCVTPWSIEPDEKCDLEYRYTAVQAEQLKQKGIIKT